MRGVAAVVLIALLAAACGDAADETAAPATTATSTTVTTTTTTTTTSTTMAQSTTTTTTAPQLDPSLGVCPVDVAVAPAVTDPAAQAEPPDVGIEVPAVYGILAGPTDIRAMFDGVVVAVERSPNFYGDGRAVRIESPGIVLVYDLSFRPVPAVGTEVAAGDSLARRENRLLLWAETPDGLPVDTAALLEAVGCTTGLPEVDSIEVAFFDGSRFEVALPQPINATLTSQSNARLEIDGVYVADAYLWRQPPALDIAWDAGAGLPQLEETHVRADGLPAESWWLTPGGCCGYLTWIDLPGEGDFVITSSAPLEDRDAFVQSVVVDADGRISFASDRYALTQLETAVYLSDPAEYLGGGAVIVLEAPGCMIATTPQPCEGVTATLNAEGADGVPIDVRPAGA